MGCVLTFERSLLLDVVVDDQPQPGCQQYDEGFVGEARSRSRRLHARQVCQNVLHMERENGQIELHKLELLLLFSSTFRDSSVYIDKVREKKKDPV